jgi:hypothetical protein
MTILPLSKHGHRLFPEQLILHRRLWMNNEMGILGMYLAALDHPYYWRVIFEAPLGKYEF